MIKKCFYLITLFCFISHEFAYAFDNKQTHKKLSELAVLSKTDIEDYLKYQLGDNFNLAEKITNGNKFNSLIEWLKQGSYEEDEPACRASNHFHNPTLPWDEAKLSDPLWVIDLWCAASSPYRKKYSNLVWATGYLDTAQTPLTPAVNNDFNSDPPGRNWSVARDLFYKSLTDLDLPEREAKLAETFMTLGYIMHLLQDMAVPAHTRNDFSQGHTQFIGCPETGDCLPLGWVGNPFEGYVRDHFKDSIEPLIKGNISIPFTGKKMPTNFWDTDTVLTPQTGTDIGLAEYTNANFVSDATIFKDSSDAAHYFKFPIRESIAAQDYPDEVDAQLHNVLAKDGKLDKAVYIAKNKDGEIIDKFLKPRYFLHDMDPDTEVRYDLKFTLDDQCYLDYAIKLIPRAIGYSASLLDYFFRGKLDIQRPAVTTGTNSTISFSVKNNTPPIEMDQAGELFYLGDIVLIYSYYTKDGTNGQEQQHFESADIVYTITAPTDPINSELQEITVDLSQKPIPDNAYDIAFTLVFRGNLGEEKGAVAAQVYKFNNSRIAYYYQPDYRPNTSNIFTISPDGSYPFQVTPADNPNPWYFTPAWSKDSTMMAFEVERCSIDLPPDSGCPEQYYSRKIAVIDLLSEQQYPNNKLYELDFNGSSVGNPSFSPDGTKIAAIMMNTNTLYLYGNIVTLDLNNGSRRIINHYDDPMRTVLRDRPAWSPVEDRIAYVLNGYYDSAAGEWQWVNDIFIVDPDGSGKIRLTDDNFIDIEPSWSPDGKRIVFSSDRDGEVSMDIWIMDKDGQNLEKIYDCSPASCHSPVFSPDGRYIAVGNGSSIYVVKSDGDPYSLKKIASPGLVTGGLAWSPFLAPPSIEAQAQPITILAGGSATLNWQSSGAKEVLVSGIDGKQSANGSITVSPSETTTYTITAVGINGVAETTVTVIVQ